MSAPKAYGKRLVTAVVDDLAKEEPEAVVYSIPVSQDVSQGFRDITARTFANAVNRTAWWLENELGKSGSLFPTVGYIGPSNDFRYILLILGCVKAGYKALLPSPRNTIDGTVALLNASSCDLWLSPKERPGILPQLLAHRPMSVLQIPEADQLLSAEPVKAYPYSKTFQQAAGDPFCVLHTSGSTGLPKPIVWKNSLIATLDATRLLPESVAGRPPWTMIFDSGDRFYSTFPLFHSAGLIMNIFIPVFYNTSNVLGPTGALPTIDLLDSLLDQTNVKIWHIIPSMVDEIGETPSLSAKFAHAKIIISSGGPATYASANKATKDVRILNITGTTEGLFQGSLLVEREDWIYFSFHPYAGFDFRKVDEGVYEHWAVCNKSNEHVALHQGIFHTFPGVQELTFKDLYTPHPTKPDLWIYKGRTDDMLVMSSGEKVRPLPMEAIINSHPAVRDCLIIGTGYPMTSLLVELVDTEPKSIEERDSLLDSILEKVHTANGTASKESRLFRESIWFASPDKPFVRTDKKTVKRRDTIMLYEQETRHFYKSLRGNSNRSLGFDIDVASRATIYRGVRHLLLTALGPSAKEIGPDDDLLNAGVDSLVASSLAGSFRSALRKHRVSEETTGFSLTPRFVYSHPTINALAGALEDVVNGVVDISTSDLKSLQMENMERFRAKYTTDLPRRNPSTERCSADHDDGYTVILTGSTGSLGSYLLEALVSRQQSVKMIYCLNRTNVAEARQTAASGPRGLTTAWPSERVQFLHADLSKPKLGLEDHTYDRLLEQTTHIIHSQWPLDHNWDVISFEPQIRGVRHLVDFSLLSSRQASLFFVSSMAAVRHLSSPAPEKPNHILYKSIFDGYGSSKHVSELVIEEAVAESGLNAIICRVGNIAGPVLRGPEKGMWAKHDWFPTVISSSKHLRTLPATLGSLDRVDWIPVDLLSDILVELAGISLPSRHGNAAIGDISSPTLTVYHAVNPTPVSWNSLLPGVIDLLGGSETVKIVSWTEWLQVLRTSSPTAMATINLKENTALKLLEFFYALDQGEGKKWPALETKETRKKCSKMADLQPVSNEWIKLWFKQWKL